MFRALLILALLTVPAVAQKSSGEFSKENLQKTLVSITRRAKQAEEAALAAEKAAAEAEALKRTALGDLAEANNANANLSSQLEQTGRLIDGLTQERDDARETIRKRDDTIRRRDLDVAREKARGDGWRARFWQLFGLMAAAVSALLTLILARQWLLTAFPFLRALKFLT